MTWLAPGSVLYKERGQRSLRKCIVSRKTGLRCLNQLIYTCAFLSNKRACHPLQLAWILTVASKVFR